MSHPLLEISAIDRAIVVATQAGLPLVPRPYHLIAEQLQLEPAVVIARMQAMQAHGLIRRIGVVPNHYRIGYRANGMSVWDVADEVVDELGEKVGQFDFVSHCYQRPRRLPQWRYNLFAMVHGHTRAEVEAQVAQIAQCLGEHARQHDVLYSTRILKKTGLRLSSSPPLSSS
jgi:DNA-binding Lrp family transcriptional regulator